MWNLEDNVAIITGGAKGIGRAYVEAFVQSGARVAIADSDAPAANRLADELAEKSGEVLAGEVDVSDPAACRAFAAEVFNRWQRIDVLVNNAAVYSTLKRKSFMEITGDEWDRVMAVNLKGMFFCAQAVFPYMKRQSYGKIINISSSSIFKGSPFFAHYVSSKAGVVGLTRALARETGEYGIRVNTVAPGLTVTAHNLAETPPERFKGAVAARCIRKEQLPDDLLGVVLFLASGHSDFITGQLINVDGGGCMY